MTPSNDGQTVKVRVRKHDVGGSGWEIDGTQQWFFVFDLNSKLWGYSRDRVHSWEATSEEIIGTTIGIGGGWEGVPDYFLQSLPEAERTVYTQ